MRPLDEVIARCIADTGVSDERLIAIAGKITQALRDEGYTIMRPISPEEWAADNNADWNESTETAEGETT